MLHEVLWELLDLVFAHLELVGVGLELLGEGFVGKPNWEVHHDALIGRLVPDRDPALVEVLLVCPQGLLDE
eukprot:2405894-Alexandrium_andersonii.AAC.1